MTWDEDNVDDRDDDRRPEPDGSGHAADGAEARVSAERAGDGRIRETTQSDAVDAAGDLLAFLRADALDVYDDLADDIRDLVDRWRREYRQDATAQPGIDVDRLLTWVAVDQYRERVATDAIVRNGLAADSVAADGPAGGRDAVDAATVADELCRLRDQRSDHLRRLGVYPVDGG